MNNKKRIFDKMQTLLSFSFINFVFFAMTGTSVAYGAVCGGDCCPYNYSCNCTQYGCDTCTAYHGTMSCVSTNVSATVKKLPYSVPPRVKSDDGCNDETPHDLTKLPFKWPASSGTEYKRLPAEVNYIIKDCRCSYSC